MRVCSEDSSDRGEEESEGTTGAVSADPGDGGSHRGVLTGANHVAPEKPRGEIHAADQRYRH